MEDKDGPPPPIGFRLDYLSMSYEQCPVSESPSDPTISALSYANSELTMNESNNPSYVTKKCCFEFGKPDKFSVEIASRLVITELINNSQ